MTLLSKIYTAKANTFVKYFISNHFPDPEYRRFLENYSCDEEKSMANPETLLGEIEAKARELIGTVLEIV